MAQVTTNELRAGFKVEMEGQPYLIIAIEFVKPGKGQAFNRIKLKHMITGRTLERTFKSGEKMDIADVEEAQMRMLYKEMDGVIFMNDTTFDQIKINFDTLGDVAKWLLEDHIYSVIFYNGAAITIEPPIFMEMKITETSPGSRGDTASGRVLKPATVESGANVQVPIFVDEGEVIKIDTRTGEYVSRVK